MMAENLAEKFGVVAFDFAMGKIAAVLRPAILADCTVSPALRQFLTGSCLAAVSYYLENNLVSDQINSSPEGRQQQQYYNQLLEKAYVPLFKEGFKPREAAIYLWITLLTHPSYEYWDEGADLITCLAHSHQSGLLSGLKALCDQYGLEQEAKFLDRALAAVKQ